MSIDLGKLAEEARTVIVEQRNGDHSIYWRVRRLPRQDLIAVVGIQAALVTAPDDGMADDVKEAMRQAAQAIGVEQAQSYVGKVHSIACAAVNGASEDGETWDDIRLVEDGTEDHEAGTMSVEVLTTDTLHLVARAAAQGLAKGVERIRPFRR